METLVQAEISIDWSVIYEQWDHFSFDADGKGHLWENKPKIGAYYDEWIPANGGEFVCVYKLETPLLFDWKDSLISRPGA